MSRRYSNSRRKVSFPSKAKLGMSLGKGANANVVKTVSKGGLFASNGVEAGWKIIKINAASVDANTAFNILKKAMKQDKKVKIEFQVPPAKGAENLKVFFDGKGKKTGFTLEPESTVVKSVDRRGTANKAGVKVGMNVVSVDGIEVNQGNIRSTLKTMVKSPRKYQIKFGSPKKSRNKMLMSIQQSPGECKDSEQKANEVLKVEQNEKKSEDELKANEEAEQRAKEEAEENARSEAEQKAKAVAEQKAKEEAEQKAKEEAEQKAKEEAELQAKEKAEQKEREEAELKAKEEAEQRAREEAERRAKEEAEQKAREAAEQKALEEAEQKAREEASQRAKEEAERKAREEAERTCKEEAEQRAKEAEEQRVKEEAEQKAKEEAELKAQSEAEQKASDGADIKAKEDAEPIAGEEAEQKSKDAELKSSEEPVVKEQAEKNANLETEQAENTKLEQKADGPETVVPTAEVVAEEDSGPIAKKAEEEPVTQVEVDTIAETEHKDEVSQEADSAMAEDLIKETKQEQEAVKHAFLESKQDTAEVERDVAKEDVKQGDEEVERVTEEIEKATVDKTNSEKKVDEEVTMEDDCQPEEKDGTSPGKDGADKDEVSPNAQSEAKTEIKEAQIEEVVERKEVEAPLSKDVKVETLTETEDEKSNIEVDNKSKEADNKSDDVNAGLNEKVEVDSKPSEGDLPVEAAAPVVSAT